MIGDVASLAGTPGLGVVALLLWLLALALRGTGRIASGGPGFFLLSLAAAGLGLVQAGPAGSPWICLPLIVWSVFAFAALLGLLIRPESRPLNLARPPRGLIECPPRG